MPNDSSIDRTIQRNNQFSVGSLLWTTAALTLLFSYARWLGPGALEQAMIFAAMGATVGLLIGALSARWQDSLFWALLVTLLAYLAQAGGRTNSQAVFYGWGLVGSFCGAMSVLSWPKRQLTSAIFMGLVSCLVMLATVCCFRQPLSGLVVFDIVSAFILGTLLKPFLSFLHWFESRSRQPRFVLASWLTISVLIGNFLVPIVGGVAR